MMFWRMVAGVLALALMVEAWAIWTLCDVIAAQSRKLTDSAVTLRLYRESRDESDRQVRDLLGQNGRLAAKLIEIAAKVEPQPGAPRVAVAAWPAGRES